MIADLSLVWITTRAAGVVALLASTASIVLGLALAGRIANKRRGMLGDAKVLHQTFGIATVVALAVHVIALAFDPWLKPALSELAIPFTLSYRPLWSGLGIIAGYGIIVLGMSGFLKERLGPKWKLVHRFTGLAWVASIAHTIGAGSDIGALWLTVVLVLCVVPVVGLTILRVSQARRTKRPTAAPPRAPRRPSPEARAAELMRQPAPTPTAGRPGIGSAAVRALEHPVARAQVVERRRGGDACKLGEAGGDVSAA